MMTTPSNNRAMFEGQTVRHAAYSFDSIPLRNTARAPETQSAARFYVENNSTPLGVT